MSPPLVLARLSGRVAVGVGGELSFEMEDGKRGKGNGIGDLGARRKPQPTGQQPPTHPRRRPGVFATPPAGSKRANPTSPPPQPSSWPTIPQLYVKGEFVGGCDIVLAMHQNGELEQLFADAGVTEPLPPPAAEGKVEGTK